MKASIMALVVALVPAHAVVGTGPDGTASSPIVVTAPERPYRAVPLAAAELARMRGGIRLPNGLDLLLGVDIQTRIDGLLALHTVYASDGALPGIRVYTDGARPVPVAPTTQTVQSASIPGIPFLVVDRSPSGTTIVPGMATQAGTVNLVSGDPSTWLSGEGQIAVPAARGQPAVPVPQGEVSIEDRPAGAAVILRSPTLEVQHLVGEATGVVVANTASDRAIDTISAINVDLRGLTPGLLAGTFMSQRAALDAVVAR